MIAAKECIVGLKKTKTGRRLKREYVRNYGRPYRGCGDCRYQVEVRDGAG